MCYYVKKTEGLKSDKDFNEKNKFVVIFMVKIIEKPIKCVNIFIFGRIINKIY